MSKLSIPFFFFLFTHSIIGYSQKTITARAAVQSATVYQTGAELSSTVKVAIPSAGMHEVVIENLPSSVNENTVQVMTNSENITILSAVFQVDYIEGKTKNPVYIKLKDSLEILTNEYTRTINQKQVYMEEQNMVLSNKVVSGHNTGLNVAELQKNADFFRSRLLQIKNEIIALEQKEKKINERLAKYRNQISQLENIQNQPLGQLTLQIQASAASNPSFKISYYMPLAGWTPVYDIRVKDVSSQPVLVYKAEVYQSSGLDWNNIKLSISSGNPSLGGTKPILNPWFLRFYTPMPVTRSQGMGKAQSAPAPMSSADDSEMPAMEMKVESDKFTSQAPTVDVQESQMSFQFDIKQLYDIPSDGKQHMVSLNEHVLKAKYQYFAVPKLDKDAFLLARITAWEGLQLLPGNANVFFENAFVGQSYIDPLNTVDTLDLSLGRDPKIVIERKTIKDFERVKVIGANKKMTFAYEISVRNTKNIPVDLVLADQVPISSSSEIEVEAEELSGGSYDKEKGEVKWVMQLSPAETKKLKFVFSVKYPKGKRIAGL